MQYKVIKLFTDLQDNNHRYEVGDTYPRTGYVSTPERIQELASSDNRQGVPLIEEVKKRTKKKTESEIPETEIEIQLEKVENED